MIKSGLHSRVCGDEYAAQNRTVYREGQEVDPMKEIDTILRYFKTVTKIPHCSSEAGELRDFLVGFAEKYGCEVQVDRAGNILARRGEPKLCLQAHYDMVCVGQAPQIDTVEREGWLTAENSSLGADNGMAVAMMMALMEEGHHLEYLFTADEEIGLIGAKALEFTIRSRYLLNLDTEKAGEVYIGCAGGVDLIAQRSCEIGMDMRPAWLVEVSKLPGGHSGVDIHRNIPNAIKKLAEYLSDKNVGIISMSGGERRNSIPVHAEAVVRTESALRDTEYVSVKPVIRADGVIMDSQKLLDLLIAIPHGVEDFNEKLGIPQSSSNLAKVAAARGRVRIEQSLRAMSDERLEEDAKKMAEVFEAEGFRVWFEDPYPAWKPQVGDFAETVADIMKEFFDQSKFLAIHAGLECGILAKKFPDLQMVSIGPTIEYPHSARERVSLVDTERIFKALHAIIRSV
jgi:dipeptidase D